MLGLASIFTVVYMFVYYIGIFFILYLIARWRDGRETVVDAQLGYKFGLNMFQYIAYNLILGGITVIFITLFSSWFTGQSLSENPLRIAGALLVSGFVIFFIMKLMLSKSNQDVSPGVGRLFMGLNWIVTGLVAVGALITGIIGLFMGLFSSHFANQWAIVISLLLVFIPASLYFGKQVYKRSVAG